MIGDIWYRYVDTEYQEAWQPPERRIILVELEVIEETAATVVLVRRKQLKSNTFQILPEWVERKRVRKNARRRWAYPTKALALNSYRHRKDWQISRTQRALDRAHACRAAVAVVEGLL